MSQRPIKLKAWDYRLGAFVSLTSLAPFDNQCQAPMIVQFTGVFDAKGREIWEGDILYYSCECDDENELYEAWYEVVFVRGAFGTGFGDEFSSFSNYNEIPYVVVGNVFENKEMLTGRYVQQA